jgi:hypothetical protein
MLPSSHARQHPGPSALWDCPAPSYIHMVAGHSCHASWHCVPSECPCTSKFRCTPPACGGHHLLRLGAGAAGAGSSGSSGWPCSSSHALNLRRRVHVDVMGCRGQQAARHHPPLLEASNDTRLVRFSTCICLTHATACGAPRRHASAPPCPRRHARTPRHGRVLQGTEPCRHPTHSGCRWSHSSSVRRMMRLMLTSSRILHRVGAAALC